MKQINCLCTDLFFKSKIMSSLQVLGYTVVFVTEDKIIMNEKIFVDGNHPDALAVVGKYPSQCYVFVPHVKTDLIKLFKEKGCKHVYARSYFFGHLREILE